MRPAEDAVGTVKRFPVGENFGSSVGSLNFNQNDQHAKFWFKKSVCNVEKNDLVKKCM